MIESVRNQYNSVFSLEKHSKLKQSIENEFPDWIQFRISESPIFVNHEFIEKIKLAVESIVSQLNSDEVKSIDPKIPEHLLVPNQDKHPNFLAIDFGICKNENGEIEPQLIELQAFPSLFFYQLFMVVKFQEYYPFLNDYKFLFNNMNEEEYLNEIKEIILANEKPENVILLELFPDEQKTKIDFILAKKYLGIETVCFTNLIKKDKKLYYQKDGKEILIKRIYNRLIFDDFAKHPELKSNYKVTDNVEVEWVTHPNWYYKISKIISPILEHQYIPKAFLTNEFPDEELKNMNQYVLKPLFSYAGKGVIMNPTIDDYQKVANSDEYIMQKKVQYAPIFKDPNGDFAKAEFRVLCTWKKNDQFPKPLISLIRMTKTDMVNVDHNTKEQIWTGSSVAFFEK